MKWSLLAVSALSLIRWGTALLLGLQELQYRSNKLTSAEVPADRLTEYSVKGREAVGEQIKTIQRLQLQLDRSDGRPDFTSDILADKYYKFLSTCLRTEGGAWTATIGPMEYVGLRLGQHVGWSSALRQPKTRTLSLPSLVAQMSSCLIDLPTDDSKVSPRLRTEAAQQSLQDLSLALTRIACRYALLKEQLEGGGGAESAEPFALALEYPAVADASVAMPALADIEAALSLDLQCTPAIEARGSWLVVGVEDAGAWINANKLT